MSNVDHPSHYNQGSIECIDAIEAISPDDAKGFCRGNAIKYLWRAEHKNGIEDIQKATWYLNNYKQLVEKYGIKSNTIPVVNTANTQPVLKFKKLQPDAITPRYAHAGDSGLDLFTVSEAAIAPLSCSVVSTGIAVELPPGYEGQVRSRSGLAVKHMIHVLNSPGTIDQGYRGEIKVILMNHSNLMYEIKPGQAIAQLVIAPVTIVELEEITEMSVTERGMNGFGSTDNK